MGNETTLVDWSYNTSAQLAHTAELCPPKSLGIKLLSLTGPASGTKLCRDQQTLLLTYFE